VLVEAAFLDAHAALVAGEPPAADGFDGDAELLRGNQHGLPARHAPAPAGGHEDDERLVCAARLGT
jgi:hypothetical protein